MEFPSNVISVLCALCLLQIASMAEADVYQPECDSLDEAVQQIRSAGQQFQSLGIDQATVNCSRNQACDGFSCVLTIEGKATELRVKLHPCEDPPQMFLEIRDPDASLPYIQETVTHEETYAIPGLNYQFMDFFNLDVSIKVEFEKVVEGVQIGLYLVLSSDGAGLPPIDVPILSPMVINTPPCPTQGPDQDIQCVRMGELVDHLAPPHDFQCDMYDHCRGFNCSGYIPLPRTALTLSVMAIVVLDSCTNPISYNVTIIDRRPGQAVWSHSFIRSESVFVEGEHVVLPPGVSANLNITMEPYTMDIDYMITSIVLTICLSQNCQAETFINREQVPIPPCEHPLSTSTPGPTAPSSPISGASDECTTMQAIASDIMDSDLFSRDQMRCHANGNVPTCDGFVCALDTRGHSYVIRVKLFHCESPVRLLFNIDDSEEGYEYHLASNITFNEVVSLDGFIDDGKVKFLLVQRSSAEIELAVSIELTEPSGQIAIFPLVRDRLVPVGACPNATTTNTPPMTKPTPTKPAHTSIKPPVTKPTRKPGPNKSDAPQNNPNTGGDGTKDKSTKPQSNGLAIGVGVGVAVLSVVVFIILGLVWYRRHSRPASDRDTLMENSVPI